jgi:serpin B
MKEKLHIFHIEKPQVIGLQLYYKSRDLSLLVLLPEDVSGLEQVTLSEKKINSVFATSVMYRETHKDMTSVFLLL